MICARCSQASFTKPTPGTHQIPMSRMQDHCEVILMCMFCGRRRLWFLGIALILVSAAVLSGRGQSVEVLLTSETGWAVPDGLHEAREMSGPIRISIRGIGDFRVDPSELTGHRPDIFVDGRFSIYDVLMALDARGEIQVESHFDAELATHVIDSVDGQAGWWYEAHYDGGWFERSVVRMDHYPVKDGTTIRFEKVSGVRLDTIFDSYRAEVERLEANNGRVVIPQVTFEGPRRREIEFTDVEVTAHDSRPDLFQPGVITALDVLLSLGEQGMLREVGLSWYESIGSADPVEHYFIERVVADGFEAQANGGCGFVYEVGPRAFFGFDGNHVHIPTDARVILSPEYALWFWLCL